MKHIDRLIRTAKKSRGAVLRIMGWIEWRGDLQKFTLGGHIWRGKDLTTYDSFDSVHDTAEEAKQAFDALCSRCEANNRDSLCVTTGYGESMDVQLFIDDLTWDGD